jgi:hypothetical protein
MEVCHWVTWSLWEKSCGGLGTELAVNCAFVIGYTRVPTLKMVASFPLLKRFRSSGHAGFSP